MRLFASIQSWLDAIVLLLRFIQARSDLVTGQIGGSSEGRRRLQLGNLAGHGVKLDELILVLLLEVGQEVVVRDAGKAERKICLGVNCVHEPDLWRELAILDEEPAELVGRPLW